MFFMTVHWEVDVPVWRGHKLGDQTRGLWATLIIRTTMC